MHIICKMSFYVSPQYILQYLMIFNVTPCLISQALNIITTPKTQWWALDCNIQESFIFRDWEIEIIINIKQTVHFIHTFEVW